MRTSVAALSCVAHLYWRTATITHSSAMPDKTAMRNTDDIRTPSLSIVLFLTPGEARIRILAEPCDYLSPRIGGVSGNDIDGILVGTQGSREMASVVRQDCETSRSLWVGIPSKNTHEQGTRPGNTALQ